MGLVDSARLQARANSDPEFRMAARYWNATLRLESSAGAFLVEIADGQITRCGQARSGERASTTRPPKRASGARPEAGTIAIAATDDGWAQFLAAVPRPYYQDLLGGCVQHHGFTVAGDVLSLSAYYQALQRLFAVMRELRADTGGR